MWQILLLSVFCSFVYGLPTHRQISLEVPNSIRCTNYSDCWPSENFNDNTTYIQCEQNLCICSNCFQLSPNGVCGLAMCFNYTKGRCVDQRPSQQEAFLLSLFLSSFGAANFYLEDYRLAVIQLSVTVALVLVCMFCCCCFWCLMIFDEDCYSCECTNSCFPACVLTSCGAIGFVLILANACWWLIDLVILGLNQRTDGNGCTLNSNL